MAVPTGITKKTKDNSRKLFRTAEEWTKRKKQGRPAQQWNERTNEWAKIAEPRKVTD